MSKAAAVALGALRTVLFVASLVAIGGFLLCVWWLFWDPIVPRHIATLDAKLIRKGPSVIEVRRLVDSSRADSDVEVCAYIKRMPAAGELFYDEKPVVPRKLEMELACAHSDVEARPHWRDRQWRIPADLEPGQWEYQSRFRFRNPLTHRDWWTDPIPFTIP
jgi:hypothetical protein